jgi:ubiquinone/menaquinone biosynthesis C-methylase UbiE
LSQRQQQLQQQPASLNWNTSASKYNGSFWDQFSPSHTIAEMLLRDQHDPLSVLDVGCGTGELAAQVCESRGNAHVVAVDASAEML